MELFHIFGVKVYILFYIKKEKSAKGQNPQIIYSKNLEKMILTQQYSQQYSMKVENMSFKGKSVS